MLPNSKATGSSSHLEKSRCSESKCVLPMTGLLLPRQKWYHVPGLTSSFPWPAAENVICQGCLCCLAYLCTSALRNQVLSEQFLPHMLEITSLSNLILTWPHGIVTTRSHWKEGRKTSWNKKNYPMTNTLAAMYSVSFLRSLQKHFGCFNNWWINGNWPSPAKRF